jgi:hypothetical protein
MTDRDGRDADIGRLSLDLASLRERAKKLNLILVVSLIGMALINVDYPEAAPDQFLSQDNFLELDDET